MLFGMRRPRTLFAKLREFIWPRAGWTRTMHYIRHRLARLPGTPYSIAAGFACGAAVSFSPFLGLHFILAGLLAWLIGANIVASAIGTAVGNPWTFPIILPTLYQIGIWILGWETPAEVTVELSFATLFDLSSADLLDYAYQAIFPTFIGSLPVAPVVWVVFYWPLLYTVRGYQRARRHRREHRAAARAQRAGQQKELG
jgi:uncharacterized protein (DUF2062 family)